MRLLLPILAAAFLAAAAPASAAPTWLTPVTVSPSTSGDITDTTIASDDAGHVAAAWLRDDAAPGVTYGVDFSLRSPGGGFTNAAALSTAGVAADSPSVGIDAAGTATVVWAEGANVVKAVRIAPDGTRSAVEDVASPGADSPSVAVAPGGAAVIVWRQGTQVMGAARADAAGEFSAGVPISQAGSLNPDSIQVAIDTAGDAVAAWMRGDVVEANPRPAGGSFKPAAQAEALSATGATGTLALALAPDGHATALWDFTGQVVQTANRTIAPDFAGGTWSGATQASPPGSTAVSPSLAVDAANTATAVWLAQAPMSAPVVQAADAAVGRLVHRLPAALGRRHRLRVEGRRRARRRRGRDLDRAQRRAPRGPGRAAARRQRLRRGHRHQPRRQRRRPVRDALRRDARRRRPGQRRRRLDALPPEQPAPGSGSTTGASTPPASTPPRRR